MSLFSAQTFNAKIFAASFFIRVAGSLPAVLPAVAPSGGGAKAKALEYEARVRAHWDRLEALQRERDIAERAETERAVRLKDRQLQLAEMERKKRDRESVRSTAVKRRQKLSDEIQILRVEQQRATGQIAALVALIMQIQTELADAERARLLLADRMRRMVLLLAAAA